MNHTELLHNELVRSRQHDLMMEADRWRIVLAASRHADATRPKRVSTMSRLGFPALLVMLGVLAALLIVAIPTSAREIDLGNDGKDLNCDEFPERNAAEGYFAHDGGSADRNVDNLDPNSDGVPCNELPQDQSDAASGDGNTESDPGLARALPDTGTGRAAASNDLIGPVASSVVLALIGGAVACNRRRESIN